MSIDARPLLVVVVGPTASGKTAMALRLAERYRTEVVSADSRQLFRGLRIGTAQPTAAELARVPHHMIATCPVTEPYDCGRYEREALSLLEELFARHRVVIAAGGSGLYVKALCEGMDDLPDADPALRAELTRRLAHEGLEGLAAQLERLDPLYARKVDRNNPARVLRALEVCLQSGVPYSSLRRGRRCERAFRVVKIGMQVEREALYARIDARVEEMMREGLEAEARAMLPWRDCNALRTVGYRELFDHFDGRCTLAQAVELIKRNTRRYAKRQMTWFRADASIAWFPAEEAAAVMRHVDAQLPGLAE